MTINGIGWITAFGVDVVEGAATASIAVTVDARSYSVSGSQNVVGDGNVRVGDITISDIAHTISTATASDEKKAEARSVISRAFESSAVKAVLGTLAESVTKAVINSATGVSH
jgi:cytochrome P450